MGNMRFKVGDRVRIKSIDWYNENKDEYDYIDFGKHMFYPPMSKYCGEVFTIDYVYSDFYTMNNNDFEWTDEMIEGLVEEEVFIKANDIYNEEYSKGEYCHEQSFKWGFQEGYSYSHENDKLEISLKEGYQFVDENGNVINAHKIVLEKKEYPKTLEECCEVLDTGGYQIDYFVKPEEVYEYEKVLITKISALYNLIICRDAYWKIAGEEMGLDGPWEPNAKNAVYGILRSSDIIKAQDCFYGNTRVLEFPTAEMRDAFKEYFGPDIDVCKELL